MTSATTPTQTADAFDSFMRVCREHADSRDVDMVPQAMIDIIAKERRVERRAQWLARGYYALILALGVVLWQVTGMTITGEVAVLTLAAVHLYGLLPLDWLARRMPEQVLARTKASAA